MQWGRQITHEHRGAQLYDGHDQIQIAVIIYVPIKNNLGDRRWRCCREGVGSGFGRLVHDRLLLGAVECG